ncbi:MAG TPA: MOSC N-terminal beta barrel domain-containing protein [Terracidiphilus sp.]|nr:MOSC N-terminal beta barrel domain-containing protein [Terracidiphilus sp.]
MYWLVQKLKVSETRARATGMFTKELWRYPVKSLAGERLQSGEVGSLGLKGDRTVHIEVARRVITARTHFKLLGLAGTTGADGTPLINGFAWDSPEALKLVHQAAGQNAEIAYYDGPERFDILPLLVATDGAIDAFGHDSRRLRPNIVIGGVSGLEERNWPGQMLRVGEVLIGIRDLRGRCVMTTYDPDTQEQNPRVLREIVAKFNGDLALNCFVLRGGTIREGDQVELLPLGLPNGDPPESRSR